MLQKLQVVLPTTTPSLKSSSQEIETEVEVSGIGNVEIVGQSEKWTVDKHVIFGAMGVTMCFLGLCCCCYTRARNTERSLSLKAQQNYADHIHSEYTLSFSLSLTMPIYLYLYCSLCLGVIDPVHVHRGRPHPRVHPNFGWMGPVPLNLEGIHRDVGVYGAGSAVTTSTYKDALNVINSYLSNPSSMPSPLRTDAVKPHIIDWDTSDDGVDALCPQLQTRGVDGSGPVMREDSFSEDSIGGPTRNTPYGHDHRVDRNHERPRLEGLRVSRDMVQQEECRLAASLAKYDEEVLGHSNETPTQWLHIKDGDAIDVILRDDDEVDFEVKLVNSDGDEDLEVVFSSLQRNDDGPKGSKQRRSRRSKRKTLSLDDDVLDDDMRDYVATHK